MRALLTSLALLFAGALPGDASDPRDVEVLDVLRVGHWVEVRGERSERGFETERIQLGVPGSRPVLWGVAESTEGSGVLSVLGVELETGAWTDWSGASAEKAVGARVRVEGRPTTAGRFWARRLETRSPGVERIEGRVDRLERLPSGGVRLLILDFDVWVPPTARQRVRGEQRLRRRVPPEPIRSPSTGLVDEDDLFGQGFLLGDSTHIGLQQQLRFNDRRNHELDRRDDLDIDDNDDREDTAHRLRARMSWRPNERLETVVDARFQTRRRDLGAGGDTSSSVRVGEAFVLARDIGFGFDLQLGRSDHDDVREWLYDQNLDGLRLFKQTGRLHWQLSATTTLTGGSGRDRDAFNTMLYVSNHGSLRHLAGYVIDRRFGDGRNETQTHFGVRLLGPIGGRWRGWLELAGQGGRRLDRSVRGWGGDLGLSWVGELPARWTWTFGFAHGSGDRGGERDGRFRQTGLQDNETRVGGVTAVRYYGELFDPELSNLQVATFGLGVRPFRRSSVELLAHRYWQDVSSTRLANSNLDRRPNGVDRELGWEVDVVLGLRRFERWDLELVLAHFESGAALSGGDAARLANLQIRYRY